MIGILLDINLAANMGQNDPKWAGIGRNRPIRTADLCALDKHVIFECKYRTRCSFGGKPFGGL